MSHFAQSPSLYFYDPTLCRHDHCLRPVIDVEPAQNDVHVPFDSPARDTQCVSDLLIVEALNDQTENVQLAWTERGAVELRRYAVSNAAWEILVAGDRKSTRLNYS